MQAKHVLLLLCSYLIATAISAQTLSYTPDVVAGHRSLTYLHHLNHRINDKFSISNLSLFDTEYGSDQNNIFFIRNTLSWKMSKMIRLNAAVGVKNPGSFLSLSAQFRAVHPAGSFAYSAGTTYQRGFTLEQSIA